MPGRDEAIPAPTDRTALGSKNNPVRAAGALCWRRSPTGELEVLLVRSARWDEWSWPKGKLETHESHPEAAVREVDEETGVAIVLGPPLPRVEYVMPDGRHKQVTYWAARPRHEHEPAAGPDEISARAWLSADRARETLTRANDHPALDRLLGLDRLGHLDAGQLIVVRHAKAVSRSSWDGDDAGRPLAQVGLEQAARLARMLECWRPERLISSPWSRCLGTFAPYENVSGLTIEPVQALSERGYDRHPERTRQFISSLLNGQEPIALCTHRPVLAGVIGALAEPGSSPSQQRFPREDPWLAPGQLMVAHHHRGQVFETELH